MLIIPQINQFITGILKAGTHCAPFIPDTEESHINDAARATLAPGDLIPLPLFNHESKDATATADRFSTYLFRMSVVIRQIMAESQLGL